jgi:hypothetical protein
MERSPHRREEARLRKWLPRLALVGARDSSSPVSCRMRCLHREVTDVEDGDESVARCCPDEEGDGVAAASFNCEGGTRWTAAEELWLSKGDGFDARLGSRRRPSVGAHAAASLAEEVAQDSGCTWWLRAEAKNGRGREWGPGSACGRGRMGVWRAVEAGGVRLVRAEGVRMKKRKEEKQLTGGSVQNENRNSKIFNWTELNWSKNGLP